METKLIEAIEAMQEAITEWNEQLEGIKDGLKG